MESALVCWESAGFNQLTVAARSIYLSLAILVVSSADPISIPEKANTMAKVAAKLLALTESAIFIDTITLIDADVFVSVSLDELMGMGVDLALFQPDVDLTDTR